MLLLSKATFQSTNFTQFRVLIINNFSQILLNMQSGLLILRVSIATIWMKKNDKILCKFTQQVKNTNQQMECNMKFHYSQTQ